MRAEKERDRQTRIAVINYIIVAIGCLVYGNVNNPTNKRMI